jgi:3-phosphoshikimate 1-carboxyvinyltransferase
VNEPLALPSARLAGTLRAPGSKSVTNRALVAAALAPGESVLSNPLDSTDTRTLAWALETLGARIAFDEAAWRVQGVNFSSKGEEGRRNARGAGDDPVVIDVGDAGTPARFLAALLSAIPGRFVLDGSPRMRERPMGPLLAALRHVGARIECVGREGYLPLSISGGSLSGGSLSGGRVPIRGDVSSQFLSALMLISPLVPGGLSLDIEGPVSSASYLELTRRTIEAFSGKPGGGYAAARYRVPGDDSAACFPIAGATVSGGRVTILGLERHSPQPDAVFRDWAEWAGARISWKSGGGGEEDLLVEGPAGGSRSLTPLDVDVDPAPDAALPLAAMLAFAGGTSKLSGAERLREKESDRLMAAWDLLTRAGAAAEETTGEGRPALLIRGAEGAPRRADFAAHGDHRVAMAAAVLALALPAGCRIDEPGVVAKSWPGFWEAWQALTPGAPRSR